MSELKGIKAGDAVLLYRDQHDKAPASVRVLRVTPTGRIVVAGIGAGSERTFHANGNERGALGRIIKVATPERIAAAATERERRDLAYRLNIEVRWSDYPLETLRAVVAVLDGA